MDKIWRSPRVRLAALSIIAAGLIAAFLYHLYVNADKYSALLKVSISQAFFLLGIFLVVPVVNSVMNFYLYRGLGAEISFRDVFLITSASTLANYLPISGAIVSKGFYLKQRYNVSYTSFFSMTLASFVFFISVSGAISVLILLCWVIVNGTVASFILWAGFSLMTSSFLTFWLPLDRVHLPQKLRAWLHDAVTGWGTIRQSSLFPKLAGLQVIILALSALRYWVSFRMLSQELTFGQAMLFANASVLSQLVSITPGDLGIREAIVGTLAAVLGFDAGASVIAVGLDRLVSTFAILLLGGISTFILGKQAVNV